MEVKDEIVIMDHKQVKGKNIHLNIELLRDKKENFQSIQEKIDTLSLKEQQ